MSAPRPRAIGWILGFTQMAGMGTALSRLPCTLFLAADSSSDTAAAAALIGFFEGIVLGVALFATATLAYKPRPGAHKFLKVLYVVAIVDAVAWIVGVIYFVTDTGEEIFALIAMGRIAWCVLKAGYSGYALSKMRGPAYERWLAGEGAPLSF